MDFFIDSRNCGERMYCSAYCAMASKNADCIRRMASGVMTPGIPIPAGMPGKLGMPGGVAPGIPGAWPMRAHTSLQKAVTGSVGCCACWSAMTRLLDALAKQEETARDFSRAVR